jgi:histidyl-tRNA synthetase
MAKQNLIQPRTLKGFRDYLPEQAIPRERLIDTAKEVFRSFGFVPIDAPCLELAEVLLGKAGGDTEKEVYRFQDRGKRDVAMRFDLTVPFARFAAQHIGQLGKPFKRYHVGTVWRGENVQRGRYREFVQCDFDTIGTRSIWSDIEIGLVIDALLRRLGIENFVIRVNHRKVLSGLLDRIGLADKAPEMLRALDKLAKIGPEKVAAEMAESAGANSEQAQAVLDFAGLEGSNAELLTQAEGLVRGSELGEAGVEDLRQLLSGLAAGGVPEERIALDLSIARGLDYYTGTIFETFLTDLPGFGSVCSGGALRRPGFALHQGRATGDRRFARARSSARGDGRAWAARRCAERGAGLRAVLREGLRQRVHRARAGAACSGDRV